MPFGGEFPLESEYKSAVNYLAVHKLCKLYGMRRIQTKNGPFQGLISAPFKKTLSTCGSESYKICKFSVLKP